MKTAGSYPKREENTEEKGEIPRTEQVLLFQQCFKRPALQTRKYQGLFWKGLLSIIPLPDDNFLALSKLKEFADNNSNMAQTVQFFLSKG